RFRMLVSSQGSPAYEPILRRLTDEPSSKVVRSNRHYELLATLKIERVLRGAAAPATGSSRCHRGGERRVNDLVTKMVPNSGPCAGIERDGTARASDFRNTNQHLPGQNETGRNAYQQISSAVRSTPLPPLRGRGGRGKRPSVGRVCIQGGGGRQGWGLGAASDSRRQGRA